MTETADSGLQARSPQPEALTAKRAASQVSTLAQLAIGSFATFSGLLYAMGYLLTLGQMRMLGAGSVDVSNQEIVRKVISIPPLSVVYAVAALFTLEGLLVGGALLLVGLCARRLGLFRQEPVGRRKVRSLMLQWFGPLVVLVIVSLYANFQAAQVLVQHDLLLQTGTLAAANHDAGTMPFRLSEYPVNNLVKLKASRGASRRVYGFQVLALVFCLTVLVGLWITSRFAEASSHFRNRGALLILGTATLFVLLQFLNIPFLYGYLVMDTKFPTIETASFPTEKASKFRPKEAGIRLLMLGSSGGKHVVYSLEHQQMWRGVADADLLPAKQLPELDPFVFANPFPRPEQIKSVSGSLVAATEPSQTQIPPDYWIDILSTLLPAERYDELANTLSDDADYRAKWEELGNLNITTQKDEAFRLALYEVHDQVGDQQDFYLVFKLSTEGEDDLSTQSEAGGEDDESSEEGPDEESGFAGRIYYRSGKELKLTPGSYYHCGDPLRLKKLLLLDYSPKSVDEAEEPAEEE